MKQILTTIQEKTSKILSLAILAGTIASCDSVLNYNEDCDIEYCVKFKYDYNMEEKDLQGESAITGEHVQNNLSVRDMLGQRGIKPEDLPPAEDIKKLERRVKSQEKKLAAQSGKLPGDIPEDA